MRIDAQHSFSDRHPLDYLGGILKRNRFDGSVLFASEIPSELPDFVQAVVMRVEQIDPRRLDEWQRNPRFRGLSCGLAAGGLDGLERRGLTLDVAGRADQIAEICDRYPRLRICVPLIPGLPEGVYLKVLSAPRDLVRETLSRCGPARMMFGSDWPAGLPDVTWKASLASFTQAIGAQPIEVREQLLGGTAREFYGI